MKRIQSRNVCLHRDRKILVASRSESEGERECLIKGHRACLWGDDNVWELEGGGGCTALWMY